MVDTLALGASGSNPVEVQVLSPAPNQISPPRQVEIWAIFGYNADVNWTAVR